MSFELILPFLRPIEPLLLDDSISEIMGNPDSSWWYERDGILRRDESVQFDAARLRTGLEVVANKLGKKLDEDNPLLNAQLPSSTAALKLSSCRLWKSLLLVSFRSARSALDFWLARSTRTQSSIPPTSATWCRAFRPRRARPTWSLWI